MQIFSLIFSLTIMSFASVCRSQNVIPPEMQAEIDAKIRQSLESQRLAAVSLSIVKNDGEILYANGYGMRDKENGLEANAHTLFAIGSASKSVTAVVIAKTLHELFPDLGEAVLDTPIRELSPSYNFTLIDRYRSEKTTFRDILAHKLCLMQEISGMVAQSYEDKDDVYYRYRYAPEECGFRSTFDYNNGMIGMAADILGHMANTTYESLLSQFLSDMGMTSTTWVKMTDDHNNMMNRAVPYFLMEGQLTRYNPELLKSIAFMHAGGGLLTTAIDITKYMQLHLNKGRLGDRQIVPEEVMAWITVPSSSSYSGITKTEEDPDVLDISVAYGLCMYLGIQDGWRRIGHGGNLPPFQTHLFMYPDLGIGIYATISGGDIMAVADVPTFLFNILQGIETPQKLENSTSNQNSFESGVSYLKPKKIVETKVTNLPQNEKAVNITLEEAVGVYGNGWNGEINITLRTNSNGNPQLYWKFGRMVEGWLIKVAPATFSLSKWETDVWMIYFSGGLGYGSVQFKFLDIDTFQYIEFGQHFTTDFKRGFKLEDLSPIPWAPGTCA
ncbi:uncharacterized protein LOC110857479 [Folsomia candida]|uniref:uncharacterized protein LOC110857479 n=1 Tax=Folsomia candida TaxID=158441 RepID=UPI0016052873|nr:uncharacterized protein LOC110857479 [Folsomia candida]